MSRQPNIKITVEGNANTGKTNIALLIKDTLKEYGIDIEIHQELDIPVNTMRDNRKTILENIATKFKDRKIVLDVKPGYDRFTENPFYVSDINRVAKEYIYTPPTKTEILEEVKESHIHIPLAEFRRIREANAYFDIKHIWELFTLAKISHRDIEYSSFVTFETEDGVVVFKSRYTDEQVNYICKELGFNQWAYSTGN
jgi:hypothetical protein